MRNYPDPWTQPAPLMESLIKNHPFVDGNKRKAVTATAIFLELNHHRLTAGSEELLRFAREVAAEQKGLEEMAAWLRTHSSEV